MNVVRVWYMPMSGPDVCVCVCVYVRMNVVRVWYMNVLMCVCAYECCECLVHAYEWS